MLGITLNSIVATYSYTSCNSRFAYKLSLEIELRTFRFLATSSYLLPTTGSKVHTLCAYPKGIYLRLYIK